MQTHVQGNFLSSAGHEECGGRSLAQGNTAQGTLHTNYSNVMCRTEQGKCVDGKPRRSHFSILVNSKVMASLDGTGAMGMEGSRTRKTEDFAIYKQGLSSSQFDSYLLSTYCMLCIKQVHLALKGSLPHCHLLVILEI